MDALWLAIGALATYRLTRLVTADKITEPIRAWASRRSEWLGYLSTCDWCLSIWFAPWPALALALAPTSGLVRVPLAALALSALTGLLALAERRLDT
jgi:hypothetical protein